MKSTWKIISYSTRAARLAILTRTTSNFWTLQGAISLLDPLPTLANGHYYCSKVPLCRYLSCQVTVVNISTTEYWRRSALHRNPTKLIVISFSINVSSVNYQLISKLSASIWPSRNMGSPSQPKTSTVDIVTTSSTTLVLYQHSPVSGNLLNWPKKMRHIFRPTLYRSRADERASEVSSI